MTPPLPRPPFWGRVEARLAGVFPKRPRASPCSAGITRPLSVHAGVGPPRELGLALETADCQTNSQKKLTGSQQARGREDLDPIQTSGPRLTLTLLLKADGNSPSSHLPPVGESGPKVSTPSGPATEGGGGGGPEPHMHTDLWPRPTSSRRPVPGKLFNWNVDSEALRSVGRRRGRGKRAGLGVKAAPQRPAPPA